MARTIVSNGVKPRTVTVPRALYEEAVELRDFDDLLEWALSKGLRVGDNEYGRKDGPKNELGDITVDQALGEFAVFRCEYPGEFREGSEWKGRAFLWSQRW